MRLFAPLLALLAGTLTAQTQTCSSAIVGTGCGPTFTIAWTPVGNAGNHTMELTATGLDPAGISIMAWGTTPLPGIPLPFGGCPLHNDFIWGHNVNPDATGTWQWSRSWPGSVQGFYYIQFGTLSVVDNEFVITSSDSRRAECVLQ